MKKSKSMEVVEVLPYGLRDLALFPTLLTLGTTLATFVIALFHGPEMYSLAAGFVLGLSIIFYSVTFVIGGLGLMIPAVLRRAGRWAGRLRGRHRAPGSALWDDWVDGP
jgi:preprotein translocase subunit SecF